MTGDWENNAKRLKTKQKKREVSLCITHTCGRTPLFFVTQHVTATLDETLCPTTLPYWALGRKFGVLYGMLQLSKYRASNMHFCKHVCAGNIDSYIDIWPNWPIQLLWVDILITSLPLYRIDAGPDGCDCMYIYSRSGTLPASCLWRETYRHGEYVSYLLLNLVYRICFHALSAWLNYFA